MKIKQLNLSEVVARVNENLRIVSDREHIISDAFIRASLRRQASFQCPCSPANLITSLYEALPFSIEPKDQLKDRISKIIDHLIIIGDLMELRHVTTLEEGIKGTWVFPSPPRFVQHPNKSQVYILGIANNELSFLPPQFHDRLQRDTSIRTIACSKDETIPEILNDYGLLEVSWETWLQLPKKVGAPDYLKKMQSKLELLYESQITSEIKILAKADGAASYKKRWVIPSVENGNFVARRPQEYGADLWGYAKIDNGRCTKFLDFPFTTSLFRGCDEAWYLQLAIDSCRGCPQAFKVISTDSGAILKFFSPLPLWAERRLEVTGTRLDNQNCLLAFLIEEDNLKEEIQFLESQLWLTSMNGE